MRHRVFGKLILTASILTLCFLILLVLCLNISLFCKLGDIEKRSIVEEEKIMSQLKHVNIVQLNEAFHGEIAVAAVLSKTVNLVKFLA